MNTSDEYQSIVSTSEGEFKDKGSRFLGYAFPVTTVSEIEIHLANLKKSHPKARHFCYAWRLGMHKLQFRANDDGEPSGTAGKPILGQIDSFEYSDILVVVVRYFGGTLLGSSGLIKAYRAAGKLALSNAVSVQRFIYDQVSIEIEYQNENKLFPLINKFEIKGPVFQYEANQIKLHFNIRKSKTSAFLLALRAVVLERSEEEAQVVDEIQGLKYQVS
jgi:uncharacterized YigZ family protein